MSRPEISFDDMIKKVANKIAVLIQTTDKDFDRCKKNDLYYYLPEYKLENGERKLLNPCLKFYSDGADIYDSGDYFVDDDNEEFLKYYERNSAALDTIDSKDLEEELEGELDQENCSIKSRQEMLDEICNKLLDEDRFADKNFLLSHGVANCEFLEGVYLTITFLEPKSDDTEQVRTFYKNYVLGKSAQKEEDKAAAELARQQKEQERQRKIIAQKEKLRSELLPLIAHNMAAINPQNPAKESPEEIFERFFRQVESREAGLFSRLATAQIADDNVDYFARFFLQEHPQVIQIVTSSNYRTNTENIAKVLDATAVHPENVLYFIYRSGGTQGVASGHFQSIVASDKGVIVGDPLNKGKAGESAAQIDGFALLMKVISGKYNNYGLSLTVRGADEKITQGQDLCCNLLASVNGMIEALRLVYSGSAHEAFQARKLAANLQLIFGITFSEKVEEDISFRNFSLVINELNDFYTKLTEEEKAFLQKKFVMIAEISKEIHQHINHPVQEIIKIESQNNGKVAIFTQELRKISSEDPIFNALKILIAGLRESNSLVSLLQYQLQVAPSMQVREEFLAQALMPFEVDLQKVHLTALIAALRNKVVDATAFDLTIPDYSQAFAMTISTDDSMKNLVINAVREAAGDRAANLGDEEMLNWFVSQRPVAALPANQGQQNGAGDAMDVDPEVVGIIEGMANLDDYNKFDHDNFDYRRGGLPGARPSAPDGEPAATRRRFNEYQ